MNLKYKGMEHKDLKEAFYEADDIDLVRELERLSCMSNFPHEVIDEFGECKWYLKVMDELEDEIIGRMKLIGGFVRHDSNRQSGQRQEV